MDIRIKCIECGDEFIFKEGEQEFYILHKYDAPKRCPQCRLIRKAYRKEFGSSVPGAPRFHNPAMNDPIYRVMYCVNGEST